MTGKVPSLGYFQSVGVSSRKRAGWGILQQKVFQQENALFAQPVFSMWKKEKFLKIYFSLEESKQRLAQLLPATCSPVPLWAKSEFNSCFPVRLLEVSSPQLSVLLACASCAGRGAGQTGEDQSPPLSWWTFASSQACCTALQGTAATHNENTTSGPKKLNFSENLFLQKCHFDILS